MPIDRRVWQEARALTQAGYRVSVICPKAPGFERSGETLDGIEIYRYPIWEASGRLGYVLEYTMALLGGFALALRIYVRTRFRVFQACNPPDIFFLIGFFLKLFGVRFIFDHHDLSPELFEAKFGRRGIFYRLVRLAERLTYRTATVSLATNESYREIAVTRGGMKPGRVFVVRSCPDLSRFRLRPPVPELREGRKHLVVYLGVMGPQEGLDLLLDCMTHIVKVRGRDDTLFALIGGGTVLPRLKELVAEKELESFVRFPGRISDDELAAYLSTAAVSVAPDPKNPMNDKSTMNKILEYMAYARPVVLFDLAEGRRSASDAALYARPNDPVDFAEKILTLLDSDSLRQELGARGRRRVEESLNWEIEKQSLLAAYQAALS